LQFLGVVTFLIAILSNFIHKDLTFYYSFRNMNKMLPLIEKLNTLAKANDNSAIHIDVMIDATKQIYEQLQLLKTSINANEPVADIQQHTISNTFQNHIQPTSESSESLIDMNKEIDILFNAEYDKTVLEPVAA